MKKSKFDRHPLRVLFACDNDEEAVGKQVFVAGYCVAMAKTGGAIMRKDFTVEAEALFDRMLDELEVLFLKDPSTTEKDYDRK